MLSQIIIIILFESRKTVSNFILGIGLEKLGLFEKSNQVDLSTIIAAIDISIKA